MFCATRKKQVISMYTTTSCGMLFAASSRCYLNCNKASFNLHKSTLFLSAMLVPALLQPSSLSVFTKRSHFFLLCLILFPLFHNILLNQYFVVIYNLCQFCRPLAICIPSRCLSCIIFSLNLYFLASFLRSVLISTIRSQYVSLMSQQCFLCVIYLANELI